MGGAKRPGRDQDRTVAREAGDAMDARGLHGLSQGRGWRDRGESPCQHPSEVPTLLG
jgi:hypothetical protein